MLTPHASTAVLAVVVLVGGTGVGLYLTVAKGLRVGLRTTRVCAVIAGSLALAMVAALPGALLNPAHQQGTQEGVSKGVAEAVLAKITEQGAQPGAWTADTSEGPLRILGSDTEGWYLVSVGGDMVCVHPESPVRFAAKCPDNTTMNYDGQTSTPGGSVNNWRTPETTLGIRPQQ